MNQLKAVIFDVDETLVDRKVAFYKLCNYFIDRYSPQHAYQGSREDLIAFMVEIDAGGYCGGLANFFTKLKKRWLLPHTIEEFITERNQVFGKLVTPFPETKDVLETLKDRYKLGVITNGYSSVQREKIRTINVEHYFDDIIVSGDVEYEKPDSRIFLLSCEHLGVKPEEAVYVGDYYPNDIAGALSANIKPIWITEDPDEHKEYSGIRINRLKDLIDLL